MAYTYRLKWSNTNMNYYGVRYAKNCKPSDLWNTYFTSSKHVKNYVKQYGDPDIIEIRKEFDSINEARNWENKVLKRLKVIKRNDYLNKTDNISIINTIETNRKTAERMRVLKTGTKNPKLSILNSQKVGDKNVSKRPEVKNKLSKLKKGTNNPMFGKLGFNHPRYGKIGASSGKKWYHDPINNKEIYCFENSQPTKYLLGRLKRIKKG